MTACERISLRAPIGSTMNSTQTLAVRRSSMLRDGFSLIELAVVLIIAGILASIAVPSFQNMIKDKAAQNARDAFVWMGARAKATAIERGATYMLELDPATERAWIVLRRTSGAATAADTIQQAYFDDEHNANVSTAANSRITICYNPRAYAWRCHLTQSPTANTDVTFTAANRTSMAQIRVLGHIERL